MSEVRVPMVKNRVAFLIYPTWKKDSRRLNKSFDGNSNIGAYMLIDVCNRNNIDIDFCTPDTANKFDIILVSFTSNYDILAFAKAVGRHPNWKYPRKFKVLGGGFGMQNPIPIREWLDYAWFGRCENHIVWLLENNLDVEHESLMNLNDTIKPVKICQSDCLYPHSFKFGTKFMKHNKPFQEGIYGCHNKCLYCHYTWSRKHIKTNTGYSFEMYDKSSIELDFFSIDQYNGDAKKLILGLDGVSERLRYFCNRKISDEMFIDGLVEISRRVKNTKGKGFFVKLYNITGFEIESDDDYQEFREILLKIRDRLENNLVLILHTTPLHPSILTPMAYSKVRLDNKLNEMGNQLIIPKTEKLYAVHSFTMERNFTLLASLAVERGTEKTQKLFNNLVFNTKLYWIDVKSRLYQIEKYFDLTDLVREYNINEKLPSWFLESYTKNGVIKKLRKNQKDKYFS